MKVKSIVVAVFLVVFLQGNKSHAVFFERIPPEVKEGFTGVDNIEMKKYEFNKSQQQKIEAIIGDRRVQGIRFYEGSSNNKVQGYAIFVKERGKHGDILMLVFISPGLNIRDMFIVRNRERKSNKIKNRRFIRQFTGLSAKNSFSGWEQVDMVTGATVTSKAVVRGAKKALFLIESAVGDN